MATSDGPIVTTEKGDVQGIVENDVFVFKGIPYAKPPVGDLRWREPADAEPWDGVRQADEYGNCCWQNRAVCIGVGGGDPGNPDEDCLYLNVWTRKCDDPKNQLPPLNLPVMVWIHGGAYLLGAGRLDPYIGYPLVNKGAVVVTLNYRLGHLGFFAHPALDRESEAEGQNPVSNFGLLDQIAALKWVHRNIEQFGGNPENVTIFGQSAGARSVLALIAINPKVEKDGKEEPLFHKAIAQSVYGLPELPRDEALKRGAKFAECHGLPGDAATAQELRGIDAEKIWSTPHTTAPWPIRGDRVLTRTILATFQLGQQAQVPLMIGSTSDDASVLADFNDPDLSPMNIFSSLLEGGFDFGTHYKDEMDKGNKAEVARQVSRDLVFTATARRFADNHCKKDSTYRYYYDYTAERLRDRILHGTRHADEIVFVFGTGDLCPPTEGFFTDADRKFSRMVSDYWFNFACTGTPAASECPTWDRHMLTGPPLGNGDQTLILAEKMKMESYLWWARLNTLILAQNLIKPKPPEERTEELYAEAVQHA
jgi:para-nitrobenzyl esterase